ncbi:hypothetical protein GAO09_19060 [Rhizobiales bacterium RZME27]|uniref:Glycosyltransferase n=1 Tax=Endobacterium cereale TaxID=2663029 RepID=A0A6A8AA29_9HYPH|nr:hypothetical protein [Endobacterium cereale]
MDLLPIRSQLVVVLGMHRSGTSVITRGLEVAGVHLGQALMPEAEGNNAKGFWEDLEFVALNEEMLQRIGREWYSLAPVQRPEVDYLCDRGYLTRALKLIRSRLAHHRSFAFKDPRTTKLLPFWERVFDAAGVDVRFVLALRNPMAVAESLVNRDGFSPEMSYFLWAEHVVSGLSYRGRWPTIAVNYDVVLEHPEQELRRLAKWLGHDFDVEAFTEYQQKFLDEDLRHSVFSGTDIYVDDAASELVRDIQLFLEKLPSGQTSLDDPASAEQVEAWRHELERLQPLLKWVDRTLNERIQSQSRLAEVESDLQQLNEAFGAKEQEVRLLDVERTKSQEALSSAKTLIEELQKNIEVRDHQIMHLRVALDGIRRSTSWRLTAPFRFILGRLKSIKRLGSLPGLKFIARHGGLLSVLRKGWGIYRREGLSKFFVVSRARIVASNNADKPVDKESFQLFDSMAPGVIKGVGLGADVHPPLIMPSRKVFDAPAHFSEDKAPTVGIFIHAYYPEQMDQLLAMIGRLFLWERLVITTDSETKKERIEKTLSEHRVGSHVVKVAPNIGRDLGPRFLSCRDELSECEFAVFLHTKRSPHLSSGETWRNYLWESVIGTPALRRNIYYAFLRNENIGMLAPHHWPQLTAHQPVNWGYNFDRAQQLVRHAGGELLASTRLDFPSGSMFWARTAALKPLLDQNLDANDFGPEDGQVDGTLAHAIERTLFYLCELSGYRWAKYSVGETGAGRELPVIPVTLSLLFNEVELGSSQQRHPESSRIPFSLDSTRRPRINLLIPTLRKAQVYGGIKTAVTLFCSVCEEVRRKNPELDMRVIVTDDEYRDSAEFLVASDFGAFQGVLDIVSATDRSQFDPVRTPLRQGDVFMASAWWNARQAQALQQAQRVLFGKEAEFLYLVQDFEPGFYPWSTKSGMAEATYDSDYATIHIVNDGFLVDHFVDHGFEKTVSVDFSLNDSLKAAFKEADGNAEREKVLIFYGRPTVERNCFELIVDALTHWALEKPNQFSEWEIYSAGESYDLALLPTILQGKIKLLGKMSLEDYARTLTTAKVGVSLMQSPHPSYPPQEMAAAGMAVVTNDWGSKKWETRKGCYFPVRRLVAEDVAAAILQAVEADLLPFNPEDVSTILSQTEVNLHVARRVAALLVDTTISSDTPKRDVTL